MDKVVESVEERRPSYMRREVGLNKVGGCAAETNAPGFGFLRQVARQRRIGCTKGGKLTRLAGVCCRLPEKGLRPS